MLTVSRRWCILQRARRFSTAADVDKSTLRLVRIHGLPTGYNLSEVVTAARCTPIQQAAACAKTAAIKVAGNEYRVELDKSGNGDLIGADAVARLGGLHAHRSLQVHFHGGTQLSVHDIEQELASAGPREFCRTFLTKSGKVGVNIAFLDEKDAKSHPGSKWAACEFMSFFAKEMAQLRRVLITEVPTEHAAALAEQVEAISASKSNTGECITYMGHAKNTMTIDFRYSYQAAHFYRRFPVHVHGLTHHLTPLQSTDYAMSLAMNSGAGRTVHLHLDSPPTLASLRHHFDNFGSFDPKIDES
ncbi:hypothetical protein BDZ89DRAFT_1065152, partial [Hymenopellis radicata]